MVDEEQYVEDTIQVQTHSHDIIVTYRGKSGRDTCDNIIGGRAPEISGMLNWHQYKRVRDIAEDRKTDGYPRGLRTVTFKTLTEVSKDTRAVIQAIREGMREALTGYIGKPLSGTYPLRVPAVYRPGGIIDVLLPPKLVIKTPACIELRFTTGINTSGLLRTPSI